MSVTEPDPTFFPQAVESVLGQTLPDFEFVIVEKPSHSSAVAMLEKYADRRIRHLMAPRHCTLVDQRNMALHAARSEYVAVIDADDICEPSRLAAQYDQLRADRSLSVLGSQIAVIDESGQVIGERRYPCAPADVQRAMRQYNAIAQPSVMLRRTAVLAAGAYQYDRFPATEDYELWSRMAANGSRLANHPEQLLRYRLHSRSLKSNNVHGILRGTLAVKRTYWKRQMEGRALLRYWAEHALLYVPSRWVLGAFSLRILRQSSGVRR